MKYIILLTLTILIFCLSCAEPNNLVSRKKYQSDHNWCINYGLNPSIHNHRQPSLETYKECMERLGNRY